MSDEIRLSKELEFLQLFTVSIAFLLYHITATVNLKEAQTNAAGTILLVCLTLILRYVSKKLAIVCTLGTLVAATITTLCVVRG